MQSQAQAQAQEPLPFISFFLAGQVPFPPTATAHARGDHAFVRGSGLLRCAHNARLSFAFRAPNGPVRLFLVSPSHVLICCSLCVGQQLLHTGLHDRVPQSMGCFRLHAFVGQSAHPGQCIRLQDGFSIVSQIEHHATYRRHVQVTLVPCMSKGACLQAGSQWA
jgi:hypothetical protein